MRILFLSQVLPYPLQAGPKVRAYYTLHHLTAGGTPSPLFNFRRGSDTSTVEHLWGYSERMITMLLQRSRWQDGLAQTA